MSDIKPCTVKGCRAKRIHHHNGDGPEFGYCLGLMDKCRGPRLTRKALNARIAELEAENADLIERGWADEKVICDLRAENADLHAEIADKKDRLARREKVSLPVAEAYHGRLVELHFSDGHPKTCGMCDDCCQCCDVGQPDPEGVYLTVRLDDSAARVHSGTVTVTYDPPKDGQ